MGKSDLASTEKAYSDENSQLNDISKNIANGTQMTEVDSDGQNNGSAINAKHKERITVDNKTGKISYRLKQSQDKGLMPMRQSQNSDLKKEKVYGQHDNISEQVVKQNNSN